MFHSSLWHHKRGSGSHIANYAWPRLAWATVRSVAVSEQVLRSFWHNTQYTLPVSCCLTLKQAASLIIQRHMTHYEMSTVKESCWLTNWQSSDFARCLKKMFKIILLVLTEVMYVLEHFGMLCKYHSKDGCNGMNYHQEGITKRPSQRRLEFKTLS